MIAIEKWSADTSRPYANLQPMVDFLLVRGNGLLDGGFRNQASGWECRLRDSLDLAAVAAAFELPSSIHLSAECDTVHDELSWAAILGPGSTVDLRTRPQ